MKKTLIKTSSADKKTANNTNTHNVSNSNGMKKQYLKTKSVCKVTFRLPGQAAQDAKTVTITGDFNNWNENANIMQKLKNGDYKATLNLFVNKEYRYKYLIDSNKWENDWTADKYLPNEYGGDDSVVVV